jgi:hypothetical protein
MARRICDAARWMRSSDDVSASMPVRYDGSTVTVYEMTSNLSCAWIEEELRSPAVTSPSKSGEIITIDFSGGPQPGAEGPKDFWVILNKEDAYIARWRHGEDPGERFRAMENQKGYGRAWEVAHTATGIRPATRQEVIKWLRGHLKTLDSQGPVRSAARLCGSCGRTTTSNLRWPLLRRHHSRRGCGPWIGQRFPPRLHPGITQEVAPKEPQRRRRERR